MGKKLYQRLLEVTSLQRSGNGECTKGDPLKTGLAVTRHDAQIGGDTALFRLLAANG